MRMEHVCESDEILVICEGPALKSYHAPTHKDNSINTSK